MDDLERQRLTEGREYLDKALEYINVAMGSVCRVHIHIIDEKSIDEYMDAIRKDKYLTKMMELHKDLKLLSDDLRVKIALEKALNQMKG